MTLEELKRFVQTEKHLPGMPTKEEVEKQGCDLGSINAKILMKVEELTLHLIELNKINQALKEKVTELENNQDSE